LYKHQTENERKGDQGYRLGDIKTWIGSTTGNMDNMINSGCFIHYRAMHSCGKPM